MPCGFSNFGRSKAWDPSPFGQGGRRSRSGGALFRASGPSGTTAAARAGRFSNHRLRFCILAASITAYTAFPVFAEDQPEDPHSCQTRQQLENEPFKEHRLHLTAAGRLAFGDGTELRLGDILFADHLPDLPRDSRNALEAARQATLAARFADTEMRACALAGETARDRYGRVLGDGIGLIRPFSLRRHLLSQGLAVVLPQSADAGCCNALYRAEAGARLGKRGVWAASAPLIRNVDPKTGTVGLPRFGFAIVEGWISSVGDRERDLYLNFGRDWSTDFTATLRKQDFSGAAEDLARFADLAGKRVRVRGVAEPWQGGRIAVSVPGQIEILTPLLP